MKQRFAAAVIPKNVLEYAKDTLFFLIFQCRKILEGIGIKLQNHFPQLETKNLIFENQLLSKVLVGKRSHSAKKEAFSSPNAFLQSKTSKKVNGMHFDQTKISKEMSHSTEKTVGRFHEYCENSHPFHRTKAPMRSPPRLRSVFLLKNLKKPKIGKQTFTKSTVNSLVIRILFRI